MKFVVIWFYFFYLCNIWKIVKNVKVLEYLLLCINCYIVCSLIFYIKKKVEGGWIFKRFGVMIFIYIFIIRECDYIVVGIYWNRFFVFLYLYSSGFGFLL